LALPRLAALAEVAWSPQDGRDFEDFQRRLETQYQRYDALGVSYHRDTTVKIGEWSPAQISTDAKTLEWDVTRWVKSVGELRVTFTYTQGKHGLDMDWVALLEDGREVARDTHDGFTGHNPNNPAYTVSLPAFKSGAHYTLRAQVAGSGGTDSAGTVNLQLEPRK
jgi:hexosaminidase